MAQRKKEEEERRQREVEEKKQRDIEEKRRRLEEAEKKRQAMMSALKEQSKSKGPNFTINKKEGVSIFSLGQDRPRAARARDPGFGLPTLTAPGCPSCSDARDEPLASPHNGLLFCRSSTSRQLRLSATRPRSSWKRRRRFLCRSVSSPSSWTT